MSKYSWLIGFFLATVPLTAEEPTTFFSTSFEYSVEPAILLEASELNGALGQVGTWTGDDFPEAHSEGYFSGGVTGGDSAGFIVNPYGGRMLFIDRPVDDVVQFFNLTSTIPNAGSTVSFATGLHFVAERGRADYELFGLDTEGHESFRVRVGASTGRQRLGYVAGGRAFFDLPTVAGVDQSNDLLLTEVPSSLGDDLADITLTLQADGYVVDFANRNLRNGYRTEVLPYNGSATELARVGLSYGGTWNDTTKQSGFYLDDIHVVTGATLPDSPPSAVRGWINDEQKIVLAGNGQRVVGLLFESAAGLLIPVPPGDTTGDVSPWEVLLSNTPNQIALGNVGSAVPIEGQVVTPAGYAGLDPESDLKVDWANEDNLRIPIPVEILDCNGDGTVNADDLQCICARGDLIESLLDATDLIAGDLDANGVVEFDDFVTLNSHFGELGDYPDGDIDCSGQVDFDDFVRLAANFNKSSAAFVPEPIGSLPLVFGMLLSVTLVRRGPSETRHFVRRQRS